MNIDIEYFDEMQDEIDETECSVFHNNKRKDKSSNFGKKDKEFRKRRQNRHGYNDLED